MSIQSVQARMAEISNIRKNLSLKYDGLFDKIYSEKIGEVEAKVLSSESSSAASTSTSTSSSATTGSSYAASTSAVDTASQDQMADLLMESMLASTSGLFGDGSSSSGMSDMLSIMMMSEMMGENGLFGSSSSSESTSSATDHVHCETCGELLSGTTENAQTVTGQNALADQTLTDQATASDETTDVLNTGGLVPSYSVDASFTGAYKVSGVTGDFSGAAQYMDLINQAAVKYNIPTEIIQAVMYTESGFRNNTRSSAGAQGLMQLMPGTADYLGVSDPYDPAQNIDGGVRYLREMLDAFGNDIRVALAAYNTGPGNVRSCGGDDNYYNISSGVQGYVEKVLGLAGYALV